MKPTLRLLAVGLLLGSAGLAVTACSNLDYYAQSVGGQMRVLGAQRPIDALLDNPDTPPALQRKLYTVLQVREFASRHLGLPDNDSYRYYADIKRPYVLWNVFATDEFSTQLETWCFPVAGCVSYRGYFAQGEAEKFAEGLRAKGRDVFVGGVPAYSTLGWFHDPVLNTVLDRNDTDLAGLIFHELAHQVVYVRNDSAFNESFATAVELEGVRRWLAQRGSADKIAAYEQAKHRQARFAGLIALYRERLKELYREDIPREEKAVRKATLFAALKQDYAGLKQDWGGYAGYDRWFARDLNNAHLASVATYHQLVPGFEQILRDQGNDLPRFFRAIKQLAKLPKTERTARLLGPANAATAQIDGTQVN